MINKTSHFLYLSIVYVSFLLLRLLCLWFFLVFPCHSCFAYFQSVSSFRETRSIEEITKPYEKTIQVERCYEQQLIFEIGFYF